MKSLPTVHTDLVSTVQNLVYVRKLAIDEARKIVPADTFEILAAPENLFSVHSSNGERLAIVEGREAAFAAARAYDLRPRSVH
jgi:hypothetical protein